MISGETQQFTIQIKPAMNYPVDLYYLMDLSRSMLDDLQKLRTLGTDIGLYTSLQLFQKTTEFFNVGNIGSHKQTLKGHIYLDKPAERERKREREREREREKEREREVSNCSSLSNA